MLGRTFDPSTTHYLASSAAQIDSGDIEDVYRIIRDKGFGLGNGSQLLILAYPVDSEDIQTFRAGELSRPSGPVAATISSTSRRPRPT